MDFSGHDDVASVARTLLLEFFDDLREREVACRLDHEYADGEIVICRQSVDVDQSVRPVFGGIRPIGEREFDGRAQGDAPGLQTQKQSEQKRSRQDSPKT